MTILVTGATGGLGRYALDYLKDLVPNSDIIALARDDEKANELKNSGYTVRMGNYDDIDSLKEAFKGVDRLLFISAGVENRQALHANVVKAAQEQGVNYIAYTSLTNAQESTSPLAEDHKYTENLIKETNIAHTFLRNNWYLENELLLIQAAITTGQLVHATGNEKTSWALKRDYAKVAAKAMASSTNFPEVLELSGPSYTFEDLNKALKEVTHKEIEVVEGTDEEYKENLVKAGYPQDLSEILLSFQGVISSGSLNFQSNDFQTYLGEPITSLQEGLKEIL